jgi:hypothetical protein
MGCRYELGEGFDLEMDSLKAFLGDTLRLNTTTPENHHITPTAVIQNRMFGGAVGWRG